MITQKLLKDLFEYKDGILYNKFTRASMSLKDQKVGNLSAGYLKTSINGKNERIHRIIYIMHHGHIPKIIDHINGNKLDNRIENLREVTITQNSLNSKKLITNTSGIKGVSWKKDIKKWIVRIPVNGKRKSFGTYFDLEVAKFVVQTMRHHFHKEFANHG
jgi:hypothetical protein